MRLDRRKLDCSSASTSPRWPRQRCDCRRDRHASGIVQLAGADVERCPWSVAASTSMTGASAGERAVRSAGDRLASRATRRAERRHRWSPSGESAVPWSPELSRRRRHRAADRPHRDPRLRPAAPISWQRCALDVVGRCAAARSTGLGARSTTSTTSGSAALRSVLPLRPAELVAAQRRRLAMRRLTRLDAAASSARSSSCSSAVRPSSPPPSPASSTSPESPREARRARLRGRDHRLARRGRRLPGLQVGHEARVGGRLRPKLGLDTAELLAFIAETQPAAWKRLARGPRRRRTASSSSSATASPSSSTSAARSMSSATASTTTGSRSGSRSSSPPTA